MTDAPVAIDREKCRGCTKCVKGCGFGALSMDAERKAVCDAAACKACYACVAACPFKAISQVKAKIYGTENIADYRNIWVFAEKSGDEVAGVTLELLTKARELKAQRGDGCKVCAVLLGSAPDPKAVETLAAYGADEVVRAEAPSLSEYEAGSFVEAVARLAAKHKPEVILAGATAIGRAFFARVAVKLRTGLTADCTALKIEETENKDTGEMQMLLHQTRPAFGGNIMATIMTPNHRPQMATVRPGVFKAVPCAGRAAAVDEVLELLAPRVKRLKSEKKKDEVDIASAEIIVSGGRGLKSRENFEMLHSLAEKLGGTVAASRAAVDAGWCEAARQVGQTGKIVSPRLYLCFGISGAIQHLEGIRGADTVVAVNSDPSAPIFGVADLGITGDALEIIPALMEALQ